MHFLKPGCNRIIRSVLLLTAFSVAVSSISGCAYSDRLVIKVVDGDTVQLANGDHLRYIGIDTPELDHHNSKTRKMALIAKRFNKKLVAGQDLILEYDAEKRDRYGRLLAYVYLEDGTFVNAELVKHGYALIMTIPPNVRHTNLFLKLQKEARENKRGFWSDEYEDFENVRKGYRPKRRW